MQGTQRDIGISALALAAIAVFTPFGGWLTIFVAAMASFAYGEGLRFGAACLAVNMIHIVFFSSRLWNARELGVFGAAGDLSFLPWILIAVQLAALAVLLARQRKFKATAASA